jgi:hypothetical protein
MLPDFAGTETFEKLRRERMSVEMRFPHLLPTLGCVCWYGKSSRAWDGSQR